MTVSPNGSPVLVTGGTGFVGRALAARLVALGFETHVTTRTGSASEASGARVHRVDLADEAATKRLLSAVAPRVVFHAAAHRSARYDDPLPAIVADDVLATASLLEGLAPEARLVHLASSLEPLVTAVPTPGAGLPLRAITKAAATQLVRRRAPLAETVILRLFHVYGPGEPVERLLPRALRAAHRGGTLPLTEPGFRRDFVYVGDVVGACLAAASAPAPPAQDLDVGSGTATTNEDLVAAVEAVTGTKIAARVGAFPPRAHDRGPARIANPGPAAALLGWRPEVGLAEGIGLTSRWMKDEGLL